MAVDAFTDATKTRREAGFLNNSSVDTTLDVTPCVNSANGEVEGAVGARYAIPLNTVNTYYSTSPAQYFLEKLATQIAASELLLQQFEGQGGDLLKMAQQKLDQAKDDLQRLKEGKVTLVGSDGVELALKASAKSAVMGFPRNSDLDDEDMAEDIEMVGVMSERF